VGQEGQEKGLVEMVMVERGETDAEVLEVNMRHNEVGMVEVENSVDHSPDPRNTPSEHVSPFRRRGDA
jgi:hypothetical protein